ncbi:Retrovirus-related Pol polyprotein from transposon TNT 1-94 [Dendrobium catenatum]|uniref:Retrovirus-related Pol polyprotein from transposon TNT 1-94 n=1 Tax=Dendrobium catenatum TaxID=906689 RepID=A0A2I0VCN4_9ASPA|nr:Retrovirus-related Pol polyprotein from transposon TNT 1-94 [Dendrobium catenatum]
MMNVKTVINTQLTAENHPIWKSHILKLFSANGFSGYLDGFCASPPEFLIASDGSTTPNKVFKTWMLVDQNLASALYSTISASLLPYVLNLNTTHDIWITVDKCLQSINRSRQLQLKSELHHLQKGVKSMVQYLSEIKQKVDAITASGSTIDSGDILMYTLNGLPPAYNAFKTAIRTQLAPISLDDFYSLLCSEELSLHVDQLIHTSSTTSDDTSFALQAFCGRPRGRASNTSSSRGCSTTQSFRGGRSFPPPTRGGRRPRSSFQCQICTKMGHSDFQCWYRADLTYQPPQKAYIATDNNPPMTGFWIQELLRT